MKRSAGRSRRQDASVGGAWHSRSRAGRPGRCLALTVAPTKKPSLHSRTRCLGGEAFLGLPRGPWWAWPPAQLHQVCGTGYSPSTSPDFWLPTQGLNLWGPRSLLHQGQGAPGGRTLGTTSLQPARGAANTQHFPSMLPHCSCLTRLLP